MNEITKKRLVVGDFHGRWETFSKIYEKEKPNEVIILGDYFDPYSYSLMDTLEESYKNLIDLRKKHLEEGNGKWIMLIGNHDLHYCTKYFDGGGCSRFSRNTLAFAKPLLEEGLEDRILRLSYVDDKNKTIYTHSGLTNYWVEHLFDGEDIHNLNFDFLLKNFPTQELDIFGFNLLQGYEGYGDTISQSPMWVRPNSLIKDTYKPQEWTQIVGHTNCGLKPLHTKDEDDDRLRTIPESDIWFIDNMEYGYYMIENMDNNYKIINREIKKV